MFFKLPTDETQSYLELAGLALSKEEVQNLVSNQGLCSFVKDMKVSFLVRAQHADKLYMALRTGECKMGLKGIEIYRIVPPIQVDDVEGTGKTQLDLTARLVYVDDDEKVDEKVD